MVVVHYSKVIIELVESLEISSYPDFPTSRPLGFYAVRATFANSSITSIDWDAIGAIVYNALPLLLEIECLDFCILVIVDQLSQNHHEELFGIPFIVHIDTPISDPLRLSAPATHLDSYPYCWAVLPCFSIHFMSNLGASAHLLEVLKRQSRACYFLRSSSFQFRMIHNQHLSTLVS